MYTHTTPKKILGDQKLPLDFKVGIICYCPMPTIFYKYEIDTGKIENVNKRYFLHTHNSHIKFCRHENLHFVVVSEVYGGPVSVTTVEELSFYGIKTIIGIGFVGSFTHDLRIGSIIVAVDSLNEPGCTIDYDSKEIISRNMQLHLENVPIKEVRVWTSNSLYKEFLYKIKNAENKGCTVVNMDTSHMYASCNSLGIKSEYYAIVSNIIGTDDDKLWKYVTNTASDMSSQQELIISKILDKLSTLSDRMKF